MIFFKNADNGFIESPCIVEILIKTTFLGVKNHEEHESGVKKIPTPRKIL